VVAFANKPAQQIMVFLFDTCGGITHNDLVDNNKKLAAPFEPAQPIESFFPHHPKRSRLRRFWARSIRSKLDHRSNLHPPIQQWCTNRRLLKMEYTPPSGERLEQPKNILH
jgi:hypothetical protein